MNLVLLTPTGEGQLGPSLARGLREAGHSATVLGAELLTSDTRWFERLRPTRVDVPWSAALVAQAARRLRSLEPDAVVVIRGRFIGRRGVEWLRRSARAPVVNYYTDNPLHGRLREPRFLRALASYDLVAVWARRLADQLRDEGIARTAVVPFAYDPALYSPSPRCEPIYDVAFVGSASPRRVEHMLELDGLRLALSGPRWGRMTRGTALADAVLPSPHWGAHAAALYRAARVGVNVLDPQNLIGHNMRTWELPATGTPMVATRTADHQRIFAAGGAVLFERPGEMREAVDGLLADEARREAVARAGIAAVADGTYAARARELVAAIEGMRDGRA